MLEQRDGSVLARAKLSGTLEDGRLEAEGTFLSGRTVSFDWSLNVGAGEPPRQGIETP